jgi:hypothetical protein
MHIFQLHTCIFFSFDGFNPQVFCLLQIKGLSNVKEEVYGALDSFVAWELEFPLIAVKKALNTLEDEKEWKRIIQVLNRASYLLV